MPDYPKPDRTNVTPNFQKTEENDALDIGWAEGTLSDGRPYRLECWSQDQVTCATVFVSRIGLESLDNESAGELLVREGLARFLGPKRFVTVMPFADHKGNEMHSINIVIGDDETTYTDGGPPLHPYAKGG